jgi:hypothetical protein
MAVADAWQGSGLARLLLRQVLTAAAEAGIATVVGEVLAHNGRMGTFMQREGFVAEPCLDAGMQRWVRPLAAPQHPARPIQAPLTSAGPSQVDRARGSGAQ